MTAARPTREEELVEHPLSRLWRERVVGGRERVEERALLAGEVDHPAVDRG